MPIWKVLELGQPTMAELGRGVEAETGIGVGLLGFGGLGCHMMEFGLTLEAVEATGSMKAWA